MTELITLPEYEVLAPTIGAITDLLVGEFNLSKIHDYNTRLLAQPDGYVFQLLIGGCFTINLYYYPNKKDLILEAGCVEADLTLRDESLSDLVDVMRVIREYKLDDRFELKSEIQTRRINTELGWINVKVQHLSLGIQKKIPVKQIANNPTELIWSLAAITTGKILLKGHPVGTFKDLLGSRIVHRLNAVFINDKSGQRHDLTHFGSRLEENRTRLTNNCAWYRFLLDFEGVTDPKVESVRLEYGDKVLIDRDICTTCTKQMSCLSSNYTETPYSWDLVMGS